MLQLIPGDTGNSGLIILVGVFTTLVTLWRESRTRKALIAREERTRAWLLEDRAAAAEELKKESGLNQVATATSAAKVMAALQENTDISVAAFKEANDVNQKLLSVHKRIDDVERER